MKAGETIQEKKQEDQLHENETSSFSGPGFIDNRPEVNAQSQMQLGANQSVQMRRYSEFQTAANNSPQVHNTAQLKTIMNANPPVPTVQRREEEKKAQSQNTEEAPRENNTGLPDNLKSGIENLSGMSLDDVKVHYNSDKPAQLNAHAYAQGSEIHVGSGQEKHLPHEAWHVVQQKQGRVKPTMQMKGKVNVNDDAGLENEADVMGAKAVQIGNNLPENIAQKKTSEGAKNTPLSIQRLSIPPKMTGQSPSGAEAVIQPMWRTILGIGGIVAAGAALFLEAPLVAGGLAIAGGLSILNDNRDAKPSGDQLSGEKTKSETAITAMIGLIKDPITSVIANIPNTTQDEKESVKAVFKKKCKGKISVGKANKLIERVKKSTTQAQLSAVRRDIEAFRKHLNKAMEATQAAANRIPAARTRAGEAKKQQAESKRQNAIVNQQNQASEAKAQKQEQDYKEKKEKGRRQQQSARARRMNALNDCINSPTAAKIAACFANGSLALGAPTRHYQTSYEYGTGAWALEYSLTGNPQWVIHGHVSTAGMNIRSVSIKLTNNPRGMAVLSNDDMSVPLQTTITGQMTGAGQNSPASIALSYNAGTLTLPEG